MTGPRDMDDERWLASQVATLGQGIEAAREIWLNWSDLRNVGRLHPGMSPGEYIASLGLRLTLAEAMEALPDGSTREIARVAGVSKDTVHRATRGVSFETPPRGDAASPDDEPKKSGADYSAPDSRVIGADGKSYPGRVVGTATVIEPAQKEVKLSKKLTLTEVRQHIKTVQASLAMLLPEVVVSTAHPAIREFAPTLNEWLEQWNIPNNDGPTVQ